MNLIKSLLTAVLFFGMLQTPAPCLCQTYDMVGMQVDESGSNGTSAADEAKKKDGKKDVVQIDEVFFINLLIDIVTVALIVLLIYNPNYRKHDNIFTLLSFNLIIFLLTYVLNEVKISMGAAFGLFAVFSMLRYRTAGISIKDMTYLFIFIAIGLLSAIQLEFYELLIINGIIFFGTFILDGRIFIKRESSKIVRYENVHLLEEGHREELLADLRKRTGYNVHRISVEKIDFLRDTAFINIYYYEK